MSELNQLFTECRQVREEADCLFSKDEMLLEISKLAKIITDELS